MSCLICGQPDVRADVTGRMCARHVDSLRQAYFVHYREHKTSDGWRHSAAEAKAIGEVVRLDRLREEVAKA